MLSSFPVAVLMGIVLGFLSGLGVGGGTFLMLWLTLVLGMDPQSARCINLLFFIPCAICSSLFRWKQGTLPIKKLIVPVLLGCIMAGIFSFWGSTLDTAVIKKIFGGLLIFAGIRELTYRPRPRN